MADKKEIFNLEYRFGGNVEFLTRIENLLNRMEKSFKATLVDAEKSGAGMKKAFDQVDVSIRKADASVRKMDGTVSSLSSKVKGLAAGIVGIGTIKTGISAFAERETLKTNLGVLLQDEKAGEDFSRYITQFAKSTPYGISELSSLANGLIQYDVSLDDTKKYMSQLGDIALGDKNKMSSLGVVLGQVASAGKLQGQDLMQFINAGWNPLTELSKMSGKSIAELRDDMSQGAISFEMVTQAMDRATKKGGKFFKGMEKGSKTLAGRWSTAMENIKQSLADAVEKNQDKINRFVERLGNLDLGAIVDSLGRIGNSVMTVTETLTPLVEKLTQIPGLAEAIIAAMAVDKLNGISGGVVNIANSFGGLEKSLRRANRELQTMGRNAKTAAMGVAALAAGGAAGYAGGALTEGDMIANGLATGGTTLAATGNPWLALLATGGSFVGTTVNAVNEYFSASEKAEEYDRKMKKLYKERADLRKAFYNYKKKGTDSAKAVLERTMEIYAKYYGDDAAREQLRIIAGVGPDSGEAESNEARSTTTNNYVTNNNSVTQNNRISTEFSELGSILKQNLLEVLENNIRFDATMMTEVAGI